MEQNSMEQNFIPQFKGGGPMLVVKNTFIDEAPVPPSLERAQTAPPIIQSPYDSKPHVALGATYNQSAREHASEIFVGNPVSRAATPSPRYFHCENLSPVHYMTSGWTLLPISNFSFVAATPQQGAVRYQNVSLESELHSDFSACNVDPHSGQQNSYSQLTSAKLEAKPLVTKVHESASPKESHECAVSQAQTLSIRKFPRSGIFEVVWKVEARKLRGGDKQAVSPPFEISFEEQLLNKTFKIMLYPTAKNYSKGGASFKKAEGKGFIIIKCESDVSDAPARVDFSLAIGTRSDRKSDTRHGSHNFAWSALCGLPEADAEWNFGDAVQQSSETFSVFLKIWVFR